MAGNFWSGLGNAFSGTGKQFAKNDMGLGLLTNPDTLKDPIGALKSGLSNQANLFKQQGEGALNFIKNPSLRTGYQAIGSSAPQVPSVGNYEAQQWGQGMQNQQNKRDAMSQNPYEGMPQSGGFYTNGPQQNQPVSPWSYLSPQ